MVLNNRKSRKNKSRKNKTRKSLRGGGLGIGRGICKLMGWKPSPNQIYKTLDDKLFDFIRWNNKNTIMVPGERDMLLRSIMNGSFGVVDIQTEDDVIELEKMRLRTASGSKLSDEERMSDEEIISNKQKWKDACSPEPILGDIIYKAYDILESGQKNGLFRVSDYQVSREEFMQHIIEQGHGDAFMRLMMENRGVF